MLINEKNLHIYLKNVNGDEQIEKLFFLLWSLHKMHGGSIELPLEDFKQMRILLLEKYKKKNRDYTEWCLLLSGYLIKENEYDEGIQLMNRALENSQERYYYESSSVSAITDYVLVLFYLGDFYLKNKENHMLSLFYYSKAYEILNRANKETSGKMSNYVEWMLDLSKKIDELINEKETLIEQKMVVSVINGKNNYINSKN